VAPELLQQFLSAALHIELSCGHPRDELAIQMRFVGDQNLGGIDAPQFVRQGLRRH
jgi:hypothetical protein